jgi:hypothetical protein
MERAVAHGSTFGGNDLAMAAGIATLDVLASERMIENAALTGQQLLRGLAAMIPRFEFLLTRKKILLFLPPPALGPNKRAKNSRFFLPPALRTDSDLRLARSTFTKPDFKIVRSTRHNANGSLEYLIINQFAANGLLSDRTYALQRTHAGAIGLRRHACRGSLLHGRALEPTRRGRSTERSQAIRGVLKTSGSSLGPAINSFPARDRRAPAPWQERLQPLTQRIRVGRVNQEVYS